MKRKIPSDAFEYYFSLDKTRSHKAVAKHYKVSPRAVTALAVKENWKSKIADLERRARERLDEKILETIEDMNGRHLKTARFLQRKGLETLQSMPITSAMDAVRTLALGVDRERLIRGEPTDRSAVNIEQKIRSEYENWMTKNVEEGDEASGAEEAQ